MPISINYYYVFYPETGIEIYYKIKESSVKFLSIKDSQQWSGKYEYYDKSIIEEITRKGIKLSSHQWHKRIRNEKIYLCQTTCG
jgi:hypothetical protein